ncbi:uncharacterized protein LOC111396933 [Olea europaea var. sylvestris]|uniref:Proteasome assembly chaperone 3 n=1 Tax=Olea europaea subsp. europaea TaxID=158383 RepID=A0A8S0VPE2_OLEEU|nr:uncharacterized protein LOC111396933 [Olea europaea var. sylvestris]CAA3032752.1 proteasome assembly chaperone 3 [Olea europaea subsp. europaea]
MDISTPTFPVHHSTLSLDIEGHKTEIIISSYEDHFLVIVTQIGSMGTILHARKEEGVSINPTFNVSVTFGKRDEPMLVACARQLIEFISASGYSKGLVLSLGLKDHSVGTLKHIVSAVIEKLPVVT